MKNDERSKPEIAIPRQFMDWVESESANLNISRFKWQEGAFAAYRHLCTLPTDGAKWNRVEDGVPPKLERCWVCLDGKQVHEGYLDEGRHWRHYAPGGRRYVARITHWLPFIVPACPPPDEPNPSKL
jgi:hypothetical protein